MFIFSCMIIITHCFQRTPFDALSGMDSPTMTFYEKINMVISGWIMRICHRMILLCFTDLELHRKTFRYYSIFIESQGCCLIDQIVWILTDISELYGKMDGYIIHILLIYIYIRVVIMAQIIFVLSFIHGYSIILNLPFVSICGVCLPCNLKNNGYACRVTI